MFITIGIGIFKLATGTLGTVTGVEAIQHNVLEPITILLLLAGLFVRVYCPDRYRSNLQRHTVVPAAESEKRREHISRDERHSNHAVMSITFLANAVHSRTLFR